MSFPSTGSVSVAAGALILALTACGGGGGGGAKNEQGSSQPKILAIVPGATSFAVTWSTVDKIGSNPVAHYKLYYDTDGFSPPYEGKGAAEGDSPIDVGNVSTFKLTNLPPGTQYFFQVTAVDGGGNETPFSGACQRHTGGFGWAQDFGTFASFGTGDYLQGGLVGDFNADSIPDVLVFETHSFLHTVGLGTGANGVWQYAFTKGSSSSANAPLLEASDFNDDGIMDYLTLYYAGSGITQAVVARGGGVNGRGDGTFAPFSSTTIAPTGTYVNPFALVKDLDNDGIEDVVFTALDTNHYPYTGFVSRIMGSGQDGRGDGTFGSYLRTELNYAYVAGMAGGDLNDDGNVDLVVASYADYPTYLSTYTVMFGDGTGGFTMGREYKDYVGTQTHPAVVDLNGDHILDIAAPGFVLYGRGTPGHNNGDFDPPVAIYGGAPADINGDAVEDLVGLTGATLGNPLRPEGDPVFFKGPAGRLVGDLDHDGIDDTVYFNGQFTFYFNLGLGNGGRGEGYFDSSCPPRSDANGQPQCVATGDLNEDGILDYAVAYEDTSVLSVFLGVKEDGGNNGNGTFVGGGDYAVGGRVSALVIADLSGDGIPDLAAVSPDQDTVQVLVGKPSSVGRGTGALALVGSYGVGQKPVALGVADLNGDRLADLVVANQRSNDVSVLLGKGGGKYHAARTFRAGKGPVAMAIGDFNGDRIADVATANEAGDDVTVLLGKGTRGRGDGKFLDPVSYPVGRGPSAIAAGDLNRDAIADLVVTNAGDDSVSVLIGRGKNGVGTGSFEATSASACGGRPASIVIGDFNTDGIPDAVVRCEGARDIEVLFGEGHDGRGTGRLAQAGSNVYPIPGVPSALAAGDIDGDGMLDLMVAQEGSKALEVLFGLGVLYHKHR